MDERENLSMSAVGQNRLCNVSIDRCCRRQWKWKLASNTRGLLWEQTTGDIVDRSAPSTTTDRDTCPSMAIAGRNRLPRPSINIHCGLRVPQLEKNQLKKIHLSWDRKGGRAEKKMHRLCRTSFCLSLSRSMGFEPLTLIQTSHSYHHYCTSK